MATIMQKSARDRAVNATIDNTFNAIEVIVWIAAAVLTGLVGYSAFLA